MSFFVDSTPATTPKTPSILPISIGLASVFVVLAIAQLFTFETFADVIASMELPGGSDVASARAAVIVTLEVVAVPFLLGMRLSSAMRTVSMVAGWLVMAAWLFVSVWVNVAHKPVASGLLGDTVALPAGWWSVFFSLGVIVLVAWVAWGRWPITHAKRRK